MIDSSFYFQFQFATHIRHCYYLLCDMMCLDLKLELRSVLRRVFFKIGPVFGVTVHKNYEDASSKYNN
jgi:hypothetical protein